MASLIRPLPAYPPSTTANLVWAFVERQTNLWKRYWGWELVWLVYGLVNTLAITLIGEEVGKQGIVGSADVQDLVLFLLLGTLTWAYTAAVIDDISLVITWERWEGTIEHTLMTPVPRWLHLAGICLFAVLHAIVRTLLILVIAVPFFDVDFGQADWAAAALVLLVGSISLAGLAILAGVLPLIFPERGSQMTFMVQAALLLVSGVYYSVDVLPTWLQAFSYASPATYLLAGVRGAVQHGEGILDLWRELIILMLSGIFLVPLGLLVFNLAERWAKKTGRLKRTG